MKVAAWTFFCLHLAALALGMFGLLSAVQNPAQFAGNATAMQFYSWAIVNLGTVDILTGAAAMLLYGIATLGWQRTAIFFIAACAISATAELTGTKTGWPFGGYAYTNFLGWKILDRVPYSVPLSWFYMGFASFLIATRIVPSFMLRSTERARTTAAIVLGAWLLTAWDLVLDPAMASPRLNYMHFWIWKETGPYFGMPLHNLVGWFATGIVFIGAGRLLARRRLDPQQAGIAFPLGVYTINVCWAMALSLSVGQWPTAIVAVLFGLAPAALSLRGMPIVTAARTRSAAA